MNKAYGSPLATEGLISICVFSLSLQNGLPKKCVYLAHCYRTNAQPVNTPFFTLFVGRLCKVRIGEWFYRP